MTLDRRPIATRRMPIFQALARALAARHVSANGISMAGLVPGIVGGVVLANVHAGPWEPLLWFAAAVCVQLRLLANMLDGMVAIESGTTSRAGELYNEIPDRISDSAVLIGLGYAAGHIDLGYAAALTAMLTAYIRAVGKTTGAPQPFHGPMAKPHRMFLVTVLCLVSCAHPPVSTQASFVVLIIIVTGSLLTCVRRLASVSRHLSN